MKKFFSKHMPSHYGSFIDNWKWYWKLSTFRFQVVATLLVLTALGFSINYFFNYIQLRTGHVISDPVLNRIPAIEVSPYIFGLIYSTVVIALIYVIPYPLILLRGMQAYSLLMLLRICCLYLFPLEPDKSIIPLEDPFIDNLFYSKNVITKDLFFSGHVSTLFLLFLIIPNQKLKHFFFIVTILVAVLMLVQHVHYSIDVLAAPFFSWLSYTVVSRFCTE